MYLLGLKDISFPPLYIPFFYYHHSNIPFSFILLSPPLFSIKQKSIFSFSRFLPSSWRHCPILMNFATWTLGQCTFYCSLSVAHTFLLLLLLNIVIIIMMFVAIQFHVYILLPFFQPFFLSFFLLQESIFSNNIIITVQLCRGKKGGE